ncbi:hypothetical protein PFISCL1PPCAC_27578 [Pristionchus fissidentatus]|uniref:MARVEL domain-containing protein n=1 Tax=Pristionchus fissidentatus TaxID=1538716 RepID=A0AAV5WW48_9BILA|nr:hypothetical protein PFISCL1PPCAC_27578 [Pristionchus fissidentatus]
MGRTAVTRGSLYNGSITTAIIHLLISVFCVLLGIYIMKEFSLDEVEANLFLLFAVVGILASSCVLLSLFTRSSVLCFAGFLLAAFEAIGFIVLFGLYFAGVLDETKALMVGDQSFLMAITAVEIFTTLFFAFAYSRSFKFLFPGEDENLA